MAHSHSVETTSTTSHTPGIQDSPFRLLDLPRELRDNIYECAVTYRDLKHTYGGTFRTSIKNCPYLQLLLSNKQIFTEYRLAIRKNVTLVLSDRFLMDVGIKPIRLPASLKRLQILQVFCFDVFAAEETAQHTAWLEKLTAEMNSLESLSVRIDVAWPDGDTHPWPHSREQMELQPELDRLIAVPNLMKLEVYRKRNDFENEDRADVLAENNKDCYVTWERRSGWNGEVQAALR